MSEFNKIEIMFIPPTYPYWITQKFGADEACWKRENGKDIVVGKTNGVCPAGFMSLYQASGLKGHNGLDLWMGRGQKIFASASGIVVEVSTEEARGYGIGILTEQEYFCKETNSKERLKYRNWHMLSVAKRVGEYVEMGEYIGEADNTGYSSGDHNHFEVKPVKVITETDGGLVNVLQDNGYKGAVDPEQFFDFPKIDLPLSMGETSDKVKWLQYILKVLGYFPKTTQCTGYYGDITRSAVLAFQKNMISMSLYERTIMRGSRFGDKSIIALNRMISR